jgi:hypothetical protein
MLDINPDVVCEIILRAREFQSKEGVVIPEPPLSPADDWGLQALADHKGDPTYLEAKTAIDDLEPDQQIILVALMWLGRGDFDFNEWDKILQLAEERHTDYTAEYLLSTPLVADFLQIGLSSHGYSCDI